MHVILNTDIINLISLKDVSSQAFLKNLYISQLLKSIIQCKAFKQNSKEIMHKAKQDFSQILFVI